MSRERVALWGTECKEHQRPRPSLGIRNRDRYLVNIVANNLSLSLGNFASGLDF
jgi:hypothetical protein